MEQKLPLYLSKQELASLYLPNISPRSSVNRFMSWVNLNTELMTKLIETGYRKTQKQFNRDQIQLIFEYLDTP